MVTDTQFKILTSHLLDGEDPDMQLYAVLDGASVDGLLDQLDEFEAEYVCLYYGELDEELEICAPYVVHIAQDSPLLEWLIQEGWGKHWGIFLRSTEDLRGIRRHLRTLLVVQDAGGRELYFRYYDPRVLRTYLPTCNRRETQQILGPVESLVIEGVNPSEIVRLRSTRDGFRLDQVPLTTSTPAPLSWSGGFWISNEDGEDVTFHSGPRASED